MIKIRTKICLFFYRFTKQMKKCLYTCQFFDKQQVATIFRPKAVYGWKWIYGISFHILKIVKVMDNHDVCSFDSVILIYHIYWAKMPTFIRRSVTNKGNIVFAWVFLNFLSPEMRFIYQPEKHSALWSVVWALAWWLHRSYSIGSLGCRTVGL